MTDREILRGLAQRYYALSQTDRNLEAYRLHRQVNDLEAARPVVLIDEIPWGELERSEELLQLACADPVWRNLERRLRRTLYQAEHMPGDMIVRPYLGVSKKIRDSGCGLQVREETLQQHADQGIVAHAYEDVLATDADLDKIHMPEITYDEEASLKALQRLGDLLGDVLPVKLCGVPYFGVTTWDQVARYRGVTNLLMDLMDRPDFMHRTMRLLTDVARSRLDQMEALGLFDPYPQSLHCTTARTNDLPTASYQGGKATRADIWGRGAAQIFAHVSKEMHDEFDIAYMTETVGQCGLVYYGCCEPLDGKIDIVEKIPHLRKISITPWADVDHAAEVIGKRYVMAVKPNPAAVAGDRVDVAEVRKEIGRILDAANRHGCSCDIVLKDISTCGNRPENLFVWEQVVMEMVGADRRSTT